MGVKQDYSKALSHYKKSATEGNSQAQLELGYFYLKGFASPANYNEALKWYNEVIKNSLSGDIRAKAMMGKSYIYSEGLGVRKSKLKSLYYKIKAIFTCGFGLGVHIADKYFYFTLSLKKLR